MYVACEMPNSFFSLLAETPYVLNQANKLK